jgi:hypothetical protein
MVASSQDGAVGQPALDTYRPLPLVTFFWDAWLAGRDTWSYHLTNTVLHALVCVGLLELVRKLAPTLPSLTRVSLVCVFRAVAVAQRGARVDQRPLRPAHERVSPARAPRRVRAPISDIARGGVRGLPARAAVEGRWAVLALPFVVLVPWLRADSAPPRTARAFLSEVAGPAMALGVYLTLRVNALHGLKTHEGSSQLPHGGTSRSAPDGGRHLPDVGAQRLWAPQPAG